MLMGREGCSFLVAVDVNQSGHSLALACSHNCRHRLMDGVTWEDWGQCRNGCNRLS